MQEVKRTSIQKPINNEIQIPGDKSISHRAIMLGSLASGKTKISNFLVAEDCLCTIDAFRSFGVVIEQDKTDVIIHGNGVSALQESTTPLYFGNSGTTARLMIGLLAGLPLYTSIYGDPYLTKRPMDRVVTPLKSMGANIHGRDNGNLLPLSISGGALSGIHYPMPVKSAQVKSAILLAGLFAKGKTTVVEQTKTRDHTEKMLSAFGADITVNNKEINVTNKHPLKAIDLFVPGDISSAAFFLVAAAIVPESQLTLKNIGLNETRTGIIDVMREMGANIEIQNETIVGGEKLGDIIVKHQQLKGITISGEIIPRLIDEIPVIALLATQATGKTIIKDAEELRVKETDRIEAVVDVLTRLGASIESTTDGMIINGNTALTGGNVSGYNDHRIAMMIAIASLIAKDTVCLDDSSSIAVSYPSFFNELDRIVQ